MHRAARRRTADPAERAALIHEQVLDTRAEQMNRTMLVLTAATVIAMPMTVVSGLLGMNVAGIPFSQNSLCLLKARRSLLSRVSRLPSHPFVPVAFPQQPVLNPIHRAFRKPFTNPRATISPQTKTRTKRTGGSTERADRGRSASEPDERLPTLHPDAGRADKVLSLQRFAGQPASGGMGRWIPTTSTNRGCRAGM